MSCLLKADPGSGAFSSPSCWSSCSTTPSVVLQSLGYSVPVPVLLLASCSALLRQHLSWEKDYVLILPEIPPDLVGLFTRFLWGHQISGISLAQVVQIKELCHLLQISSQFHVDVVKPIPKSKP